MDSIARYREIFISPIRESAHYTPKFGHNKKDGFSLPEFKALYGSDAFYSWLGLDDPLMYAAHKAAGGITSLYRQIGIGCERLVRVIFMDCLGLTEEEANWSYKIRGVNGKTRTLSLDGRILFDAVRDPEARRRVIDWKQAIAAQLELTDALQGAMSGIVFEVRQGYKSKDSKRQSADLTNASNAYANGYIPCLMVMSSQIDDDIAIRYQQAKWALLRGRLDGMAHVSTYSFFRNVVGFDLAAFMVENQAFFQAEVQEILTKLMRAE
ncbi:MAG: hypothetical protein IJ646_07210 [Clostridia bacterium]|nr:hypothetical protein [Clostridia bacterium]